MMSLDHPNIIKYRAFRESSDYIFIEMELCKGGSLSELIDRNGRFTELQVASMMKQIFSALHFIHEKGIVHRDIKPANILVADKENLTLKIGDFGVSAMIESNSDVKYCTANAGTPIYMAPE